MLLRRGVMTLPLALVACATTAPEPEALPPLVTGYAHLTPIRLNVASIEVLPPDAGAIRVSGAAPLRPEAEMARMARERLVAAGTEGTGRVLVRLAEFRREPLPGGGLFAGEPGERISTRMQIRLDVAAADGRSGFIEAEARRQRTLPDGSTPAARRRGAEEVVRQAMDDLNIELEFQIRRTLRSWIVEAVTPPAGEDGVQREDLPRG